MIFSVRPFCLAFCVFLAGIAGAAGAQVNTRFDGTWAGTLVETTGHCIKFDDAPVTAVIDRGNISVTSKDGGTITLRGRVDEYDEAKLTGRIGGSGGWYSMKGSLHVLGRFRGEGFRGTGRKGSCQVKLVLRRSEPPTKADLGNAGAAGSPSAPATTLATVPAPPQAAALTRFDGVWAGKVSECNASKDVKIQIENGRFVYTGRVGRVTRFEGRIDEITGDITGLVTQGKGYSKGARALKGRVRGNKLSAKGQTWSCWAEIILVREGPPPARVALAPTARAVPPRPGPSPASPTTPQANNRFDGVWSGTVSVCDAGKKVKVKVENGQFVYKGKIAGLTQFQGRINDITGEIKGYLTEKDFVDGPTDRVLRGRVQGGELRAKAQTFECVAEIRLTREGPPLARVAAAAKARTAPPPLPAPPLKPQPALVAPTKDETPPVIDVPADITSDGAVVEIAGRVTDRSLIGEVTVDGRPIPVAADGSFSVRRVVPVGTSSLRVAALDEWGNRAESSISVTRQAESVAPAKTRVAAARDTTPPVIDVPAALKTGKTVVTLAGKVTDASRVVKLTLDGRPLTLDGDGGFSVRREVALGASVLKLAAVDEWGNRSVQPVQVTRLSAAEALGIDFGRYHALVIGNDEYRDLPNLKTAVADARAVAKTLRQDYGFQVNLLENATGYEIKSSISRLRRTLTEKDNLLVYYAGHGVVDNEVEAGFWLPVDAERDSDANWIANSYLSRNLRAINAKHVMVVADSCYSGTLVRAASVQLRSARERNAWLERMAAKRSRTALVSGGLEPVMDSGGGKHSVFAKAFLAALADNDGVIDGQSLFEKVERPVILNSDQTPDYADIRRAGHEGGEFLFVRR